MKASFKYDVAAKGATISKWFKKGEQVEVVLTLENRLVLVETDDKMNFIVPIDSLNITPATSSKEES